MIVLLTGIALFDLIKLLYEVWLYNPGSCHLNKQASWESTAQHYAEIDPHLRAESPLSVPQAKQHIIFWRMVKGTHKDLFEEKYFGAGTEISPSANMQSQRS